MTSRTSGTPTVSRSSSTIRRRPARSEQPGLVHSRSLPGQHHPVGPHQRRWSSPDAVLAAAQHGAVERVHPGEQLRAVGRATEQRRPRRLRVSITSSTTNGARSSATRIGRRQPGLQQLPERRELVRRRWTDVHEDAEPLDRQQLRGCAVFLVNVRYGLNRRFVDRQTAVGGLRPRLARLRQQRRADRPGHRVPRIDVQGFQSLGQTTFTDLVIAPTTHQFNSTGRRSCPATQ